MLMTTTTIMLMTTTIITNERTTNSFRFVNNLRSSLIESQPSGLYDEMLVATNQQRDSTDEVASYNFKAMNFPMLGNVENYNSSIMAKNFGSEQHITASEKQRPSNEIKRSQVNRSLTQISNYGNVRNVWKSQVSVCFVRFLTRLLKCLYVCPSVIFTIININLEKIFLVFLMSKLFVFIKVIFCFSGRG